MGHNILKFIHSLCEGTPLEPQIFEVFKFREMGQIEDFHSFILRITYPYKNACSVTCSCTYIAKNITSDVRPINLYCNCQNCSNVQSKLATIVRNCQTYVVASYPLQVYPALQPNPYQKFQG